MTQSEKVLDYIKTYGSITPLEAFADLGILRLGARIFDLRAAGVGIKAEIVKSKNRQGEVIHFARYSLED